MKRDEVRYVPPAVPQVNVNTATEQRPSFRGQVSDSRVVVFAVMAVMTGSGVGFLTWRVSGNDIASLATMLASMVTLFVTLYIFDSFTSTGFLHKRLETGLEIARLEATTYAAAVNEQQAEQIAQLWIAVDTINQRLAMARTIRVGGIEGEREVPMYDTVDAAIDQWLTTRMFDANGMLVGVWPKNLQLKSEFPFKGDSPASRQALARVVAAGLIGKNPNSRNYPWTGPGTYTEANKKLSIHRGKTLPEVD